MIMNANKLSYALVFLGITVLLSFSAQAQNVRVAEAWTLGTGQEIYKKLMTLESQGDVKGQITEIENALAVNPEMTAAQGIARFLTFHTFSLDDPKKTNSDFYRLYARIFFYIARLTLDKEAQRPFLQNALAGAMAFEILSMADGARCSDRSGWGAYKTAAIFPLLKEVEPTYFAFNPLDYQKLIDSTLKLDEAHIDRPENRAICLATGKADITKNDEIFVDPYTWISNRKSAHGMLKKFWIKRYETATKIKVE